MKTAQLEIYTIKEKIPNDSERVLVWNKKFKQWNFQVYNDHYNCWDTEDGDDYDGDVKFDDIWCKPEKPE